jgi:hypothetical protein
VIYNIVAILEESVLAKYGHGTAGK